MQNIPPDPCPTLIVERGPHNEGVGSWVPEQKHRLVREYLRASRHAWKKWPQRALIDPFSGPGRIQVRGESFTRDGGAMVAWRALCDAAPFTHVLVGDIEGERAKACEHRFKALGVQATSFTGPALQTVPQMIAAVPKNSLSFAYIDPYNLELLSFDILKSLAKLRVDLAINFSTMDLHRNMEFEFDPKRARFDSTAPGWRDSPAIRAASKSNAPAAFFRYWCDLVTGLGFTHSREMPLVPNDSGHPIYRMVFFARHDLPNRIWDDVARGPNRPLDLFNH
jgi:three-Cys-motif partner protein